MEYYTKQHQKKVILELKWNIETRMGHLQSVKIAYNRLLNKYIKKAETLVTLDFRHFSAMSVRGFEPRTT